MESSEAVGVLANSPFVERNNHRYSAAAQTVPGPSGSPPEDLPDVKPDVYLPDQDVSLRDVDVVEAPFDFDLDAGGIQSATEAVSVGAHKVWDMLLHMSTIFPDRVGPPGTLSRNASSYDADARRCGGMCYRRTDASRRSKLNLYSERHLSL